MELINCDHSLLSIRLNAFLEGFYDIIPKRLISIFNEQELELLISGLPNVDIEDLKANTEYHKYQANSIQVNRCPSWKLMANWRTVFPNPTKFTIFFWKCRFNGSGVPYAVSIKLIVPSSCNSWLVHRRCHCKDLAHLKAWMVCKSSKFTVTIDQQSVFHQLTHGKYIKLLIFLLLWISSFG